MKGAWVWVRVVSQENGTTVAWKGTQANDPVTEWVGDWSVDPLGADGYFQNYKPSFLGSVKTFDRNKNVISNAMRLVVESEPTAPETYTNNCKEEKPFPPAGSLAHGGTWSNHFCTAGYTYEIGSDGLPLQSNTYCQNDIGLNYWKEDYLSTNPVLDCDGTPRIWPLEDPDGCFEGLRLPYNTKPTGQGVVHSSWHHEIVPLLDYVANSANPAHWADMAFDGYWSYTYQAWEQYENTDDIDTVLTLYPPTNHFCTDIRWFNNFGAAQEQNPKIFSNPDGSCTAKFNPKGGGNLLIMEIDRVKNQSCTVQFEDLTNPGTLIDSITTTGSFNVRVIGNSSEVIPPATERTRLWFSLPGFAQYTGTLPDHFVEFHNVSDGRRYYEFKPAAPTASQQCLTNSENSCLMQITIPENTLDAGEYEFFCDSPDQIDPPPADVTQPEICSGNPACTMNGGIEACAGWADCTPDSQTPKDHGTVTIQCVSSCDACSTPSDTNSCTGLACGTGSLMEPPDAPRLSLPAGTQEVISGVFPIEWVPPADTTNLDAYQYIVYQDGAYANPDDAWAAGSSADDVLFAATTSPSNLGFPSINAAPSGKPPMGRNFVAAVRSHNSPVGSCPGQSSVFSSWDYYSFVLVGTVSGNIYDDPTDSGSTSTLVPGNFPGGVVTFGLGQSSFGANFGQTGNVLAGNNSYTIANVPFHPSDWGIPLTRQLAIAPAADPANTYVCSGFPNPAQENSSLCIASDSYSPMSDGHFFVKSYNLAFSSWWQSWGGNIFGKGNTSSAIPDGGSSPCENSSNCHPHLVAQNYSQASSLNQSAGVPVTGSVAISTGNDSRYSEQEPPNSPADNPHATGQITEGITIENYTYFISGTDLDPANSVSDDNQNAAVFDTQLAGGELQDDGITRVVRYETNLTLDLSSTKLAIPSGEKYVVFIPGNLTIQGPTSNHNLSTQRELIKVTNGGYLAFIVGGNITFDSAIGYDDTDGDYADVGLSATNAPNIEGVYIASGNLIISSKDSGNPEPEDYKFVGAGTFVGWSGVQVQRKFDSSDLLRRQLNNLSPTELFIHRPDFVTNTPDFLMRPNLTWQEVP